MRPTMMDYPLTLPTILERAANPFHDVPIVCRAPDKSYRRSTLGKMYIRAQALATALKQRGLKKGERVATLMWNHEPHVVAYYGIPCAGGVLHTLNLRLAPEDIGYIASHAGDRFLIVDEALLPLYEKWKHLAQLEQVFVVRVADEKAPLAAPYEDFDDLLASANDVAFVYPEIAESDASGVCYTSGTTGRPKGVVYSHRSTVLHALAISAADALGVSMRDVVLPVVPQFHVNAWGLPYAAVMAGSRLVLPGAHLDPVSLLDLMASEQVTLAAGVPTVWLGILQALDKEPTRWKLAPGLRMVVGGSAAPEGMIRGFDKHGIRILHAWGMTEMSPVGTAAQLRPELDEATEDARYAARATQGMAVPFVEMRLQDDDGATLPHDGKSAGELQVRGPWIAASYVGEAAESDGRWTNDGWFRTGDVATIDALGYMRITDRAKDVIKSGGEWISSIDLENALMGHPSVLEACVVAYPHEKWAERPLAVVVLKADAKGDASQRAAVEADLHAHLAAKFAKWWLPDGYVFAATIPRTSSGKFLKTAVREEHKGWKPSKA